ncbi:lipase [Lithospermum erythrorhizon]|uniref:Lipase n=1 Tax=Lithospermum erythrorhizon TaxID=34254 RepID=A0AAV3PKT4_LITER
MVKEGSLNEEEASLFESSEMLATFLASTPLLEEAWKLCNHANTRNPSSFTSTQIGDVTYLAFSGVQAISGLNPSFMMPLETSSCGIFSGFHGNGDDEGIKEPVGVHQGFLNLFLSFYNNPKFQQEMVEISQRSKSIVLTGHSVGGAIASLAALWLLCYLQTVSSPLQVLCITFGSPMLGNKPFSEAILEERWGGNFCHLIAQDDIVPSLLFAPNTAFTTEIHCLAQYWNLSMSHPYFFQVTPQLSDEKKSELFHAVLASLQALLEGANYHDGKQFWPFGSYMFCNIRGSICLDNSVAILNILYVMLAKGSPRSSINSHLKYGECVGGVLIQLLWRRGSAEVLLPELNYDAGVRLALESSGISSQESLSELARASLELAKQQGRRRNINSAKLTVELYNTKKLRVQIEWYKGFCDASDDQMGYYDSFKRRGPSKREHKVNLNRLKLARFWDNVLDMLEKNQLPYDFHKQLRWVNAAQFYKLLVEPLEIAEYYRNGMHNKKGHYVQYGREKRYKIFDKWWRDRNFDDEKTIVRTDFASLTQDSCYWAKVEEARDSIIRFARENDPNKKAVLHDKIIKFEQYARDIIKKKEISKDVLARNSSFCLFQKEWEKLSFDLNWKQTQLSVSFCSNLS